MPRVEQWTVGDVTGQRQLYVLTTLVSRLGEMISGLLERDLNRALTKAPPVGFEPTLPPAKTEKLHPVSAPNAGLGVRR